MDGDALHIGDTQPALNLAWAEGSVVAIVAFEIVHRIHAAKGYSCMLGLCMYIESKLALPRRTTQQKCCQLAFMILNDIATPQEPNAMR